ncbi:DUF5133 domain-containing protein [Streptomyces sp. NPDC002588]|uniref:DUF5133 domain-containing protein n=1 Tax=Streptomyces sp. NPDC002588 TaxID=3154419 RepID=UPI00331D8519
MLMPHPAVLRTLVEEYEALTAADTPEARARAQDLAYTLCVSTGTRDVGRALVAARGWLAAAEAADLAGGPLPAPTPGPDLDAASEPEPYTGRGPYSDRGPHVYA